jgi:hypothetical protein
MKESKPIANICYLGMLHKDFQLPFTLKVTCSGFIAKQNKGICQNLLLNSYDS